MYRLAGQWQAAPIVKITMSMRWVWSRVLRWKHQQAAYKPSPTEHGKITESGTIKEARGTTIYASGVT